MPHYAQILVPRPFSQPFDYALPEGMQGEAASKPPSFSGEALGSSSGLVNPEGSELKIGTIANIPFGRSDLWGVVWSNKPPTAPQAKIKAVAAFSDLPPLQPAFMRYLEWVADYSFTPLGAVLGMVLPVPAALTPPTKRMGQGLPPSPTPCASPHRLSPEQQAAADELCRHVQARHYHTTLLDGITGSGKTEVYSEAIRCALNMGRQVLVLLPEIVLTSQLMARFERSLGFTPLVWHSGLSVKQRREGYRAIAKGHAKLVVGARSALFLPYPQLALVVVDEEHEASYKQEEGVLYHARDMAVARAHHEQFPVVLVSASPSLETLQNVQAGKFSVLHLHERHGEAVLPDIQRIDMRREKLDAQHFLSAPLKAALVENLVRKEQSLLYLNRRGYAPLTLCRHCGYRFQSPDSSAWMVLHVPKGKGEGFRFQVSGEVASKPPLFSGEALAPQQVRGDTSSRLGSREGKKPYLMCHHSGFRMALPETCPECGEKESFAACGPGVERLQEEVSALLPQARVEVMTSDTVATTIEGQTLIDRIERGEVDIIIGTQMVAKGHHFPNLTLVGVVDADLGLEGGDLRAAERSFQLLQQVAGRAGREGKRGRAMLQTYQPENAVMEAIARQDRDAFIAGEFARRKQAGMPPYTRLASVTVSGKVEDDVRKATSALAKAAPQVNGVRLLGPAPAQMLLLRGNFRYRLLLIANRNIHLQKLLHEWLDGYPLPSALKLKVDIDPYSFV